LLHLNCCHEERAIIGQLALGAAAALNDPVEQASILIDDLGWGLYLLQRPSEAKENIDEALNLLTVSDMPTPTPVIELSIKAKRHLVSIEFERNPDVAAARNQLDLIRKEASTLQEPSLSHHLAQLNHTEAVFVLRHITAQLGQRGVVDPTGELAALHQEGIFCVTKAEEVFGKLGDIERQVKSLKVAAELLRHGRQSSRLHAAESRLARVQAVASRKLLN
jgi:hypothetical protein